MNFLGIDIGGTSVKLGIITEEGKLIGKSSFTFDYKLTQEDQIRALGKFANEFAKSLNVEIESVGIGCPGAVNSKDGTCEYSNNIPWFDLKIVELLESVVKKPCYIANDANVAVLGEAKFGSAKNYNNVILITLGTGVGGGLFLNGQMYEGVDGKGAELGHMTIDPFNGRLCTCGEKGCIEAYASATALIKDAKVALKENPKSEIMDLVDGDMSKIGAKQIFDAAKHEDEVAIKLVNQYVEYLCYGLINYINIFRPEVILLSGGVSNAGEFLTSKVNAKLEEKHYGFGTVNNKKIPVLIATLGSDTGIFGAAALAMAHK